jgi:hypothetical protein
LPRRHGAATIRDEREDKAMGDMASSTPARVLIVARRTAATPKLLAHVRQRAQRGPCRFTLLVPGAPPLLDRHGEATRAVLELAIPLLEEAAGGEVKGATGHEDPLIAVERALAHGRFDEVIVSTLPERVSRWLRLGLPAEIERLGVPVTVVTAEQARWPVEVLARFGGV